MKNEKNTEEILIRDIIAYPFVLLSYVLFIVGGEIGGRYIKRELCDFCNTVSKLLESK